MSAQLRLLVVADDLGLAPEVDAGILETIRAGTVAVADLLVNPPFRPDPQAVREAGGQLGLHLNLSHGRPCADPSALPSLVTPSGDFLADRDRVLTNLTRRDAEIEFHAQFEAFLALTGAAPCHISLHKHLHAHHRDLFDLAIDLARGCGARLRTVNPAMRDACRARGGRTSDHFIGEVRPAPYWTLERLREHMATLPEGLTELMCHPGYASPPIHGLWYLPERETERQTFLSPEAHRLLARPIAANRERSV